MKKPEFFVDAKTVLNTKSGFKEKLLCDGLTFTAGTSCHMGCSFCYVPSMMEREPNVKLAMTQTGKSFEDIAIRRKNPVEILRNQLTYSNGKPKYKTDDDQRVVYASPLVDVAANMELARETVEMCKLILELTNWDIRLLSKSNLLPFIAKEIPVEYKGRMIFGVSTGTFDDKLAASFEQGTALVSKRVESIRRLQVDGWRTFGMICPSLPYGCSDDYEQLAYDAKIRLNTDQMEHVWAEVMNVRGASLTRTEAALRAAGYVDEARRLKIASSDADAWEAYSRDTFEAHAKTFAPTLYAPEVKLRFLQYPTKKTLDYWKAQKPRGAVLLGKVAHG